MTTAEFLSLCTKIYGLDWTTAEVARDLVRDHRSVRRWKSGWPIPLRVQDWLRERAREA